MAKRPTTKKGKAKPTADERERRAKKQQLQKAHRQMREIRTLATRLSSLIQRSDDALRDLAVELAERFDAIDWIKTRADKGHEPPRPSEPDGRLQDPELGEETAFDRSVRT